MSKEIKITKISDSIWNLPMEFDQESFFGATDEEWEHLANKTGADFIPFNVMQWEYGEHEQEIVIGNDGTVYVIDIDNLEYDETYMKKDN